MSIDEIKAISTPILKKNKVKKAALFGSVARQEQTPSSDIDMLVELDDSNSLLDFIGIKQELEDALHKKVDLVEYDAIKPALKEYILNNPVTIYG